MARNQLNRGIVPSRTWMYFAALTAGLVMFLSLSSPRAASRDRVKPEPTPAPVQDLPDPTAPAPDSDGLEPDFDPISQSYKAGGRARIAGAGDVMLHGRCRDASSQRSLGEVNNDGYDELFPGLAQAFSDSDLAIANMEFPVFDQPMRGAPFIFFGTSRAINALGRAGFTALTCANNHGYDQGREGPGSTARECRKAGMPCVGAGETRAEAEAPYLVEINGMRLAIIGYALVTNGDLNQNKDDAPRINGYNFEPLLEQVKAAAAESDGVVVAVHWGAEYLTSPLALQKNWARDLAEAGAVVIFGHHPHVLEPIELIETSSGRRCLVAYSLGNFVSNQDRPNPTAVTRIGAIVKVDLELTDRGVEPVWWDSLAVWTYNGSGRFEGKEVVDIHAEVAPLMIQKLRSPPGAGLDAAQDQDLERRVAFYQGRIEAVEKILGLPRPDASFKVR